MQVWFQNHVGEGTSLTNKRGRKGLPTTGGWQEGARGSTRWSYYTLETQRHTATDRGDRGLLVEEPGSERICEWDGPWKRSLIHSVVKWKPFPRELDWLRAVLKPSIVPCGPILKSFWISAWPTESWWLLRLPQMAAWQCLWCTFYKVISFLVPHFDSLSVFLWGAQISTDSVIFAAIVAGGARGGAPAARLHCQRGARENSGKKMARKKGRKAIGKRCRVYSHSWSCTLQEKGSTGDRGRGADMLACLYCLISL